MQVSGTPVLKAYFSVIMQSFTRGVVNHNNYKIWGNENQFTTTEHIQNSPALSV